MMTDEFVSEINQLVGKPCWGVAAGPNTGGRIDMHFGRKVPWPPRLYLRPGLSDDQPSYQGEMNLFIFCAWRLDSQQEIVCGSDDDNSVGGPMVAGLGRLTDRVVVSCAITRPAFDLSIAFGDDLVLRVFCDSLNEQDFFKGNYGVYHGSNIIWVGPRSRLYRPSP